MSIKNIFILTLIGLLNLSISACSTEDYKPASEIINPVPISEIHERYMGSAESCLASITNVLNSNEIELEDVGSDNKFRTRPIRIKDFICGTNNADRSPVPCSVVIKGQILSESPDVSVLRLSYEETCLDQNHISIRCKDSNAERLLFRLHRDFSSGNLGSYL